MAQVKMQDFADRLPSQLSGGQQQRVALARALVSSSELIVLDEPITNLDAKLREEMAYEIRNLQKTIGVTVIYITHDQETAMTISDRMVIMDKKGVIRQLGTPEEIWNHPKDRDVYAFLGVSTSFPCSTRTALSILSRLPENGSSTAWGRTSRKTSAPGCFLPPAPRTSGSPPFRTPPPAWRAWWSG
mgnify:CR=1 FL=1